MAGRTGPRFEWVWDSWGPSTAIKTKLCHNSALVEMISLNFSPHCQPLLPPSCSPSPCSSPILPPGPADLSSAPICGKNKWKKSPKIILSHHSPPGIGHNNPVVHGKVILWKSSYLPLTDLDLMSQCCHIMSEYGIHSLLTTTGSLTITVRK